jgi:hypothetical protein
MNTVVRVLTAEQCRVLGRGGGAGGMARNLVPRQVLHRRAQHRPLPMSASQPHAHPGCTDEPVGGGLRLAVPLVASLVLVACGGGSSKASGSDRAATAGVCVNISGEVATAVNVGVKLGAQSLTPAQAQAQLQPILTRVTAVAQQNSALPIGPKLQALADAISKAEKASPTSASQVRSGATDIGSAAKGVLAACAQVAR